MNGAIGALVARPSARGVAFSAGLSAATILLLELLSQAIDAPVAASGSALTIAVIAATAGTRAGLVSALLFTLYGTFVYSVDYNPLVFSGDGLLRLTLLAGTGGAIAVLVGLLRSRAEQQRLLAVAQAGEVRQRMVTETSNDAIVTIDEHSIIRFANPATERMFGRRVEGLIGTSLTALMPEAFRASHLAALRRYVETERKTMSWHAIELVGLRADGQEFPVEVSFAEFRVDGRRTFSGTIRDISQRKLLEAQLVESQRMEAVGRMAGAIAHDFNNILTAVSGYATLVRDQIPEDDPIREDVEGIQHAADGATALVRQLLAFSRRQVLHPQIIDLSDTIDAIMPMIGRLIGEQVVIDWRRPESPTRPIEADPTQLDQVVLNLALNARDAMPDGGTLTIEIADVELDDEYARTHIEVTPGPYVMLAVSDTGVGMDRETLTHVFEPFYTTKKSGQGTGLGLATVYGIVKQSHGSLSVYSEPGHGATFKVYFPEAQGVAVSRTGPLEPTVSIGGAETILVAEDEEAVRELVRTVLARLGYRVITASDGAEAIEIAKRQRIDLLLTDVIMPGVGGPETAARIRVLQPHARILFMSGYTAGAIDRQSLLEQDATLLQKPFTPGVLSSTVRSALSGTAHAGDVLGAVPEPEDVAAHLLRTRPDRSGRTPRRDR